MKRRFGAGEIVLTLLLAWVIVYPLLTVGGEALDQEGADARVGSMLQERPQ